MNALHLLTQQVMVDDDDYGYQYVETHLGSRDPSNDDEDSDDFPYDDLDHDHDHDHDSQHSSPSSEDTSQDFTDDYLVPEVRYHHVLVGIQSGKSHSTISKETGIPKSTVGSIKKRWDTKGHVNDGRKHNGRPPKLTPEQLRLIETTLLESRDTMSSTELLKVLKFDVSARTIRRAKKVIVEKKCQETRNSVVMAARSLAAAAAAATGHQSHGTHPFRSPLYSWPSAS